jgi:hypothetical protein
VVLPVGGAEHGGGIAGTVRSAFCGLALARAEVFTQGSSVDRGPGVR